MRLMRGTWFCGGVLGCVLVVAGCDSGPAEPVQASHATPVVASPLPAPRDESSVATATPATAQAAAEPDPAEQAAEPPREGLEGRWLLGLTDVRQVSQLWIIEFQRVAEGVEAKLIESAVRGTARIENVQFADPVVDFRLIIDDQAWAFNGVLSAQRVLGSIEHRDQTTLAVMDPTRLRSLRGIQSTSPQAGRAEIAAAQQAGTPQAVVEQLLQLVDRYKTSPLAFEAVRGALRLARRAQSTEDQLRGMMQTYHDLAGRWGPRWAAGVVAHIAYDLATGEGPASPAVDAIALEVAQRAREALAEDASAARRQYVELAYAAALVHNARAVEAMTLLEELLDKTSDEELARKSRLFHAFAAEQVGELDAAIDSLLVLWPDRLANTDLERVWTRKHGSAAGLPERLDQVYLQRYPPLAVEKFAGRTDPASNHVVLAELFTGINCTPCIAPEIAAEALGRIFDRTELVLLEYHLHVPGHDPMTNGDTEERARYYMDRPFTPLVLIDGREIGQGGRSRQLAPELLTVYRDAVAEALNRRSPPQLDVTAARTGDDVTITVRVREVPDSREQIRLRLALVEQSVRCTGFNGIRLHHHVVRAMPGGAAGIAVDQAEVTHELKLNIADLRETLSRQLDEVAVQVSQERGQPFEFPARPLELRHLSVAAFLQDDGTQSVIQTAFAPVADGEEPKAAPR